MNERVSSEIARDIACLDLAGIRELNLPIVVDLALDLLDARAKIENVDREDRQARAEVMDLECVNGIKHCNPVRFCGECVYCAIEKAERELDEVRKAVLYLSPIYYGALPESIKAQIDAARAAGEGGKDE